MRVHVEIVKSPSITKTASTSDGIMLDLSNMGGTIFPLLRVTAIGASGRKEETVISISGRNGKAVVVKPQEDFPFDTNAAPTDDTEVS